ncbi:hypothetical protein JCM3770_004823 [Rhodotorula araucariae]
MPATPSTYASSPPFAFPASLPSSSANPAHVPFPSVDETAPPPRTAWTPHRHVHAAQKALQLVQRLADQVDGPARGGGEDANNEDEQGIIANLESHGWVYQETTSGVRIFHSSCQDDAADPSSCDTAALDRSVHSARSLFSPTRSTTGPTSRGLRADEALPFFRGEGWIEGSWRRDDVAATITSLGARAVWDPRMDASKSQIVQHLNETDSLAHLSIRSSLVAPRDACLLSTSAPDARPEKSNVTYVAATSVEDALVPRSGSRTKIHINGFALRSFSRPPDFEAPTPVAVVRPDATPPTRPAHRRTRSTASVLQSNSALLGTIPLPPLPSASSETGSPLQRPQLLGSLTHIGTVTTSQSPSAPAPPPLLHTMSAYTSASSSYGASMGASEFTGPYPPFPFAPPPLGLAQPKRPSLTRPHFQGPGLAVSMVVRASAGLNLPQTTVNQLSVLLPLNIAAIGRFLAVHGFAPYIVRTCGGVKVREEEFDAQAGRYRTVFTVAPSRDGGDKAGEARIRLFGGAFGRGRFHVEVRHVEPDGWRLDFDVPPGPSQEGRLDLQKETEEIGGQGTGQWSSRLMVMLRGGSEDNESRQERKGSVASLLSPVDRDGPARDPALQPGPLGGCTINISVGATQPGLPVVVTVTRSTNDSAALPLAKMRGMSTALAQASQVALDDYYSLCDSVEDLLACSQEGDARADLLIRGARTVLHELDVAREREQANASVAAAAAAFAKRARRPSAASSMSTRRDGSNRRGSADAITFNSPFPRPRKVAPPSVDGSAQ